MEQYLFCMKSCWNGQGPEFCAGYCGMWARISFSTTLHKMLAELAGWSIHYWARTHSRKAAALPRSFGIPHWLALACNIFHTKLATKPNNGTKMAGTYLAQPIVIAQPLRSMSIFPVSTNCREPTESFCQWVRFALVFCDAPAPSL